MAYLILGGVTVGVAVDSVSFDYEDIGVEQERSPSGALSGGSGATKRQWRMRTTPVSVSERDAWVGLIEGKGHSWSFDTNLYSSRGRGTSSGTGTIVTSSPTPKWGAGLVRVAAGVTVTWAAQVGSSWTTLHWRYESGAWKHYVCRSDNARWVNGVRNDASAGGLSVASGSVSLTGASSLTDFDGLVALPYSVPDSWPAALYTQHNSAAWSTLPRLSAAGTFDTASVTVRGKVTGSKVIACNLNGVRTSGYLLDFTLREV